ncbi:hypothetical protein ACN47E_009413 [Coniothyrium glycines]
MPLPQFLTQCMSTTQYPYVLQTIYKNEYVWKLAFHDSENKVSSWKEYVNVGLTREFHPKLRKEMEEKARRAKIAPQKEGE